MENSNGTQKLKKGFATLTPERRKEIASLGGKRAWELKKAHQWTSQTASEAGRKGGKVVAQNRSHMSEIGRLGGASTSRKHGR